MMLDTQTFDNFLTENFLSKIFGAIKYLCLELVLTLHFLLNYFLVLVLVRVWQLEFLII
jgi:hypothetical protein